MSFYDQYGRRAPWAPAIGEMRLPDPEPVPAKFGGQPDQELAVCRFCGNDLGTDQDGFCSRECLKAWAADCEANDARYPEPL